MHTAGRRFSQRSGPRSVSRKHYPSCIEVYAYRRYIDRWSISVYRINGWLLLSWQRGTESAGSSRNCSGLMWTSKNSDHDPFLWEGPALSEGGRQTVFWDLPLNASEPHLPLTLSLLPFVLCILIYIFIWLPNMSSLVRTVGNTHKLTPEQIDLRTNVGTEAWASAVGVGLKGCQSGDGGPCRRTKGRVMGRSMFCQLFPCWVYFLSRVFHRKCGTWCCFSFLVSLEHTCSWYLVSSIYPIQAKVLVPAESW